MDHQEETCWGEGKAEFVNCFPASCLADLATLQGPSPRLTWSFAMTARAHSWALYSSCRRSGFSWNRGSFLAGSSSPKQGDCALGTSFISPTKMKGLNMDLERKERCFSQTGARGHPEMSLSFSKHFLSQLTVAGGWWVGGCQERHNYIF